MIRTREGRIRPLTAFEAVPFVRSGTPPSTSLAASDWRHGSIVRGSTHVDAKSLERIPLFAGPYQPTRFTPTSTRTFDSGVTLLTYTAQP